MIETITNPKEIAAHPPVLVDSRSCSDLGSSVWISFRQSSPFTLTQAVGGGAKTGFNNYSLLRSNHYRVRVRAPLRIEGEEFFVERDSDLVFLRHPMWSLMGHGNDLLSAELSLRDEARQLAQIMAGMPLESLDFEAMRLREFVLRIA